MTDKPHTETPDTSTEPPWQLSAAAVAAVLVTLAFAVLW